jgi:hypothetical protein
MTDSFPVETASEPSHGPGQAAPERRDGEVEESGDLGEGQLLDDGEGEDDAVVSRESSERFTYVFAHLGVSGQVSRIGHASLGPEDLRGRPAHPVPKNGSRDRAQPRLETGRVAELTKARERADEGLLRQVLRLVRISEGPAHPAAHHRPVAREEPGTSLPVTRPSTFDLTGPVHAILLPH